MTLHQDRILHESTLTLKELRCLQTLLDIADRHPDPATASIWCGNIGSEMYGLATPKNYATAVAGKILKRLKALGLVSCTGGVHYTILPKGIDVLEGKTR